MIGGLPGFRQQDAVHGLPLQLSPEEVTLALARGWAVAYAAPDPPRAREKRRRDDEDAAAGEKPSREPSWTDAVAPGRDIVVPLRDEDDEPPPDRDRNRASRASSSSSLWTWPRTRAQRVRRAVFFDMHARGLTMTPGAKFGADYLAYPGDPMAYHASFAVRVAGEGEKTHALTLAAAARMAHGARKHLVLASAGEWRDGGRDGEGPGGRDGEGGTENEGEEREERFVVSYVTVTPDVELSSNRGYRGG